jgi:hypothetical protein
MTEPKRALLTVEMAPGELRVLKVVARCRGQSMTGLIRELLRRELIDLER